MLFRLDGKQDEVDCASSTGDPTGSTPAIPIVQNQGINFIDKKNYLNIHN